jgi:hypothetical protein
MRRTAIRVKPFCQVVRGSAIRNEAKGATTPSGQAAEAPMLTLRKLFARRASDAQKHEELAVPFLDRMINRYPILGYSANPPAPQLSDQAEGLEYHSGLWREV